LAGQNVVTIENTIRDAFSEPMELTDMIRLTFITGAGKLGRARYDENAAKAVTSTLRELGYEDDRGASAVLECAGSYKLQHDTGKNLKTVVVFPKVTTTSDQNIDPNTMTEVTRLFSSLLSDDSIHHKIAYTSMNVFPRMIESQCMTWIQKKVCIAELTKIMGMLEKIDDTLLKGQPLSEAEQEFYNSLSISSLEEKITCVRDLMQKQVEKGQITLAEKQQLLSQVESKIKDLQSNIVQAEEEAKTKRVENLKDAEKVAMLRKGKLDSIVPLPPPRLKNESEISKLRTELAPLLEFEASVKGRLLTLKESQSIARKDDIQNEIKELEVSAILLKSLFFVACLLYSNCLLNLKLNIMCSFRVEVGSKLTTNLKSG
jgi:hypothetical protein